MVEEGEEAEAAAAPTPVLSVALGLEEQHDSARQHGDKHPVRPDVGPWQADHLVVPTVPRPGAPAAERDDAALPV